MKKILTRILIVVLCLVAVLYTVLTVSIASVAILSASSCTNSTFFIDLSEYGVASYNVVWTECNKKIKSRFIGDDLSSRVYYRIENVPVDQYIACKWRNAGLGTVEFPVLMQHKDYEGNLELDTSSAKLYLGVSGLDFSDDNWQNCGQQIMKKKVAQIDSAIAEDIAKAINTELLEYDDVKQILLDSKDYLRNADNDYLYLVFSLKEYNNLFWVAHIIEVDGNYLLEIKEDLTSRCYLLCSDEFTFVIDELRPQYGI